MSRNLPFRDTGAHQVQLVCNPSVGRFINPPHGTRAVVSSSYHFRTR